MEHATLDDTLYFYFASNDTSGSGGDGASPVYDVRLAGAAAGAAPVLSGSATLLTHANFPDGCHEVAIAATTGNGFAAGNTYAVFCTLLIDSQNPTGFIGKFILKPIIANVLQWLATAVNEHTAGYPVVTIKDGTGTGEINTNSGKVVEVETLSSHTPQTGDSYAVVTDGTFGNSKLVRATTPANTLDVDGSGEVTAENMRGTDGANTTKTGYSLSTAGILAIWHQLTAAIVTASTIGKLIKDFLDAAISSRASSSALTTHDNKLAPVALDGGGVTIGGMLTKIADDNAGADFDATNHSLKAIRDRGDAAWITGGGGGITDILNIIPLIPASVDLANTATVRLALRLINSLDDLPSTAEITPGTISIERKAIGGTSWTAIVTDVACSEINGQVYYDEVFDSGTGYVEGDSLRITFKNQKITVAANDYEIFGNTGAMFYTEVRQTMVSHTPASTRFAPDLADTAEAWTALHVPGTLPTGETVTMGVWRKSDRTSVALDSAVCREIGSTGEYVWSPNDITSKPTTYTEYFYLMTASPSGKTARGNFIVHGYPKLVHEANATWEVSPAKYSTLRTHLGIGIKQTGLNDFQFPMYDTSGNLKTGLTVTSKRLIDGGAFAPCTNSATEASLGMYRIDLTNADLNGDMVSFEFSAPGMKTTTITIKTTP